MLLPDQYVGDNGGRTDGLPLGIGINGLPQINFGPAGTSGPYNLNAMAFDQRGTIYLATGAGLFAALREYSTEPPAQPVAAPPEPLILAATQRVNSTLLDIYYRVIDLDTNQLTTGLLVFVNNGDDLSTVFKPTAFAENTASNLGAGISANQTNRVTWDASEFATNFVNLQFEVLANDGRTLLPLEFVTVPAFPTNAPFVMSRSPVQDSDLLSVWYWLLATNNPSIALTNGTLIGVGGAFAGQTLAAGGSTTMQGRAFLYPLLNIRAATASEVAIAESGNFGFISINPNNSVVKLP